MTTPAPLVVAVLFIMLDHPGYHYHQDDDQGGHDEEEEGNADIIDTHSGL